MRFTLNGYTSCWYSLYVHPYIQTLWLRENQFFGIFKVYHQLYKKIDYSARKHLFYKEETEPKKKRAQSENSCGKIRSNVRKYYCTRAVDVWKKQKQMWLENEQLM